MEKTLLLLILAALLPLSSCAGPVPTSEAPAPAVTPEAGANMAVLDIIDEGFSDQELKLRFFVFPGSGPMPLSLSGDEYGEEVRALFGSLDWQEGEGPRADHEEGGYGVHLLYGDRVLFLESGSDTVHTSEETYFHAEGAQDLCDSLLGLWPGPELRYTRMPGVEHTQDPQDCIQRFMEAFGEYYWASGAVTDFDLRGVQVLEELSDDVYLIFRADYAVKPADSGRSYWQDKHSDEEGWVEVSDDIELTQAENGLWKCSCINAWNVD